MSNLVLYSIPAFLLLIVVEIAWARRHPEAAGYELRDTAASLTMGLGNVFLSAAATLLRVPVYLWIYEHRFFDLPRAWWTWLVLLFAEDLCYYWFHRLHHEVRVLWSTHVNHHSSLHYNLSTALRQPWATPLTGPIFWVPLLLVGFAPEMVLTAQAVSLLYQFWLHTEAIGKLGPLEWIFNTPSHHRVHHGANPAYLDKNHGGIFIIWDRLFRTFAPEIEPVRYGLTKNVGSFHPLRIAFHDMVAMLRQLAAAPGFGARLRVAFGRPSDQLPS
ncbi:MAG: sterol desaturase family protein [Kofleriaceae bacterium]